MLKKLILQPHLQLINKYKIKTMAQTVLITLTTAGTDTGPFDLFSDADSYVTAFENNVPKASLVSGYTSTLVPDLATIIRVQSDSLCTNYIDLPIVTTTTTTSTSSTTTTTTTETPTTTTTTTTAAPVYPFTGSGYSTISENDACSDAIANNRTLVSDCAAIVPGCVIFTNPLGTNPLLGQSFVLIGGQGNFDIDPLTGVITAVSAIQC
jgi:hypothetical protein